MLSTEATAATNRPGPVVDGKLVRTNIGTPLGSMIAVADDVALYLLEFENRVALTGELRRLERDSGLIGLQSNNVLEILAAQLEDYFAGECAAFQIPTIQHGTAFEESVWQALRQIPPGQTRSYGEIAEVLGQPEKSREVGQANGANKISIVVPCHRVIGADGSLVGYGGGIWRKKWLLDHERRYAWKSFEHK
ncbi:MAG TPA: methylated-DNA--[protein]-cysteine S-methyltransferase [Candidatus Bathyarchaeia archaeon]|nr:methylated-DNA--[protein]-cysteine S-methyltransferase [Candidatus Bathyarchaeia archaeon]